MPDVGETSGSEFDEVRDVQESNLRMSLARSELQDLGCFIDPAELSAVVGFTAFAVPIEERLAGDPALVRQSNYTLAGFDEDSFLDELLAMYSTSLGILGEDSFAA